MKLSEMTPEQKSRWIAEKLEPSITLPEHRGTGYHGPSPNNAWHWRSLIQMWRPRDMTEPAMTMMLIKELLRSLDYECIISQDEIEMGWMSVNKSGHSFMVSLINNTLEQGVADAFMLANGFEEET